MTSPEEHSCRPPINGANFFLPPSPAFISRSVLPDRNVLFLHFSCFLVSSQSCLSQSAELQTEIVTVCVWMWACVNVKVRQDVHQEEETWTDFYLFVCFLSCSPTSPQSIHSITTHTALSCSVNRGHHRASLYRL